MIKIYLRKIRFGYVKRCLLIMLANIFKTFTGILPGPAASKLFISLFVFSTVAALIFSSVVAGNLLFIIIMFEWFLNL